MKSAIEFVSTTDRRQPKGGPTRDPRRKGAGGAGGIPWGCRRPDVEETIFDVLPSGCAMRFPATYVVANNSHATTTVYSEDRTASYARRQNLVAVHTSTVIVWAGFVG